MNIKFNEISLSEIIEKCEQDRQEAIAELKEEKITSILFSFLWFGLSLLSIVANGVIVFCHLLEEVAMIKTVVVILLIISTVFCFLRGVTDIQAYLAEKSFLQEQCKPDYSVNKRMPNLLNLKNCNQILEASFDEDGHLIITIDDNGEVKEIEFSCNEKKTRTDIDTVVINFEVENYQGFSIYIPYGQEWEWTNLKIQNPDDIKKAIVG